MRPSPTLVVVSTSWLTRKLSLCRIVLAIPASSAKSERVFSTSHCHLQKVGFLFNGKGDFSDSLIRCSLAPSKVEKLTILKENRKHVKEFKNNSEYKMKERGVQNAFNLVEAVIEERGLNEEELGRYYDDVEDEFEKEEEEEEEED